MDLDVVGSNPITRPNDFAESARDPRINPVQASAGARARHAIVMAAVTGLNTAKIAAIAAHTARRLTREEAGRCAVLIPCSRLNAPCSGSPVSLLPAQGNSRKSLP